MPEMLSEEQLVTERRKPVLDDGHSWMVRGQAPLSISRSANEKFKADATHNEQEGRNARVDR